MIEAVIFDMDGLMYNTEVIFKPALQKVAKRYGVDVPDYVCHQMIGCDSRVVSQFEEHYPGITKAMETFQKERLDIFLEMYPEPGSLDMLGLRELVAYLNEKKIPYAIASSSKKEDIERLNKHSLAELKPQEIVSSKEKGIPSKPDPTIFKTAASRLGKEPDTCLVLEDSKYGIMAGRRAGCHTVFIPDQVQQDRQMYPYVQNKANSLLEVIDLLKNQEAIL